MTRPLVKNRGPRQRQLRWLAEHPNYGRCKQCGKWRQLLTGLCGACLRALEVT